MNDQRKKGRIFVIATPIGNLQDVSARAIETLSSVEKILCEDTRVTSKLLATIGVQKTLVSYHQHSTFSRVKEIVGWLREGKSLALVTDAGTPGISDPGGKLIQMIVEELGNEIAITPIPGPNAAIAALSVSGFPADEFLFLGFPPHKKGRQSFFRRIAETESTVVFYESTHRILKTLEQLGEAIGDRPIVVGRELTKLYETIYRGTVSEVTNALKSSSIKGEFVVVVRCS